MKTQMNAIKCGISSGFALFSLQGYNLMVREHSGSVGTVLDLRLKDSWEALCCVLE